MQTLVRGANAPQQETSLSGNLVGFKNYHQPLYVNKTLADCLCELCGVMQERIGNAPNIFDTTGKLIRFDIVKRGDKAGWYVVHIYAFGMTARFGSWYEGQTHNWTSFEHHQLSQSYLADLKRQQQQQARTHQLVQQDAYKKAQAKALRLWQQAKPASPLHPYLMRKQVQPYGICQLGDSLLVPIRDLDGILHNVQFIKPNGDKRFLSGGRKRGLSFVIGDIAKANKVGLVEGFATGASLHLVNNYPVIVAFDAGNLLPVAQAYRTRYEYMPLILCADNDRLKPINTGVTKAREVQKQVYGVDLLIPEFPKDAPSNLTDFNDLANWISREVIL